MRVSKEQAAENRGRILDAAARLFREKGFDGIGVDGIMKEAGLTHGGFYGHFRSKEDLTAQACARALALGRDTLVAQTEGAENGLAAYVGAYLSQEHRDDSGGGCAFAALGPDIARQSESIRQAVTQSLRTQLDDIEKLVPADPSRDEAGDRRARALATFAGLVGALILARAVDDPALSDELLQSAAATFGGSV